MKTSTTDKNTFVPYSPLTGKLAFQLAAPHTWTAAFIGVMVSWVYALITYSPVLNLCYALLLLIICVLMQSAVNIFNDYFDYKKGTDSLDNSSADSFDAVLVYHHLNPRSVLRLGIVFLVAAGLLGLYLVITCGWILLVIGCVGAAIVVLYSAGKTPISYLPIGEAVSGIVMGILIPLACVYTLTGVLDAFVVVISLPLALGIGLILATNNTCDIEKDIVAQRKTLAVILGRSWAMRIYRGTYFLWLVLTLLIVSLFYTKGLIAMLCLAIGLFGLVRALMHNPLNQSSRDAAMSQIVMSNVIVTAFYCLALLLDAVVIWC